MDLVEQCKKACSDFTELKQSISAGGYPSGVEALAIMISMLNETIEEIKEIRFAFEYEAHTRLSDAEKNTLDLFDGSVIQRYNYLSRKNVDRDGLIDFLREHPEAMKVSKETGELEQDFEKLHEITTQCFRQEPRWSRLKDFGVEDEDYCEKEVIPKVRIVRPEAS